MAVIVGSKWTPLGPPHHRRALLRRVRRITGDQVFVDNLRPEGRWVVNASPYSLSAFLAHNVPAGTPPLDNGAPLSDAPPQARVENEIALPDWIVAAQPFASQLAQLNDAYRRGGGNDEARTEQVSPPIREADDD